MAFNSFLSGDRFGQRSTSLVPKRYVPARWVGGAPGTPAVGQFVKQDTTAGFNDGVVQCVSPDVPYGLIESINSSNGTLSIWLLSHTCQLVFQYKAGIALGNQIQTSDAGGGGTVTAGTIRIGGNFRDQVLGVAAPGGIGLVVAIDQPQAGLCVVEFHGGAL